MPAVIPGSVMKESFDSSYRCSLMRDFRVLLDLLPPFPAYY